MPLGSIDLGLNLQREAGASSGFQVDWLFVAIILAILLIGGIVIYLVYQARIYNKRIVVFENISGQGFRKTYADKARVVKLGDGGEELLYLKKKRAFRTAYGKKMGKNTY